MPTRSQAALEACSSLYAMAVKSCAAAPPPSTPATETDALAASIAAQSNAMASQANNLTIFNFIFAVALAVAAITWGFYVRTKAQRMAKEAAEEWMERYAPGMIAELNAEMQNLRPSEPAAQADALEADPAVDPGQEGRQ